MVDKSGWWSDSEQFPPGLLARAYADDARVDVEREHAEHLARGVAKHPEAPAFADALAAEQPSWCEGEDCGAQLWQIIDALDAAGLTLAKPVVRRSGRFWR